MLVVSNITKQFAGADEPILKDISFVVNAGERIGLIGPNGAGKSTLLHIVMGHITADAGSVRRSPPDLRIGYLAQGLDVSDETSVQDVLCPERKTLGQLEAEIERLAAQLGEAKTIAELRALSAVYDAALERLRRVDTATDTAESERVVAEVGLSGVTLETPVWTLSGGQKTRLGLAALLLRNPQLLILDEPTNHLDVSALEWLEEWLLGFAGGALVVSHDRTFLDEVTDRIVAIDDKTHTARAFEGGYSEYAATIQSEIDRQWAQWRDQQVEIARLETDARETMAKAVRKENATNNDKQRRYAKKVAKRAKAKEKRLERYLASDERVDKPKQTWKLKLDLGDLPTTGQDVVHLDKLTVGYDAAAPLLRDLNLIVRAGERVAVLGPNGQGKSSLLKTIIGDLAPLSGRVRLGSSVRVGYLAQEQETLEPTANATTAIQAVNGMNHTDARSFLHFFLFAGDDALRPISALSFGERSRLMLALLVARGANLLVLDEPTNHLDVPSRERFEAALSSFPGSVLAVVHDRYFVDRFATTIWHIEGGALREEVRQPLMA